MNKYSTFRTVSIFSLILAAYTWASGQSTSTWPTLDDELTNITFVAFDTETTGFSSKYDRIVEVGAVKFKNGKVIETKSWLINPQRNIPVQVQHVHGITPPMVKNSPSFSEFYPEFEAFIANTVLMAHNASFDVSFVREELERANIHSPSNYVIDSLKLFRHWYPDAKSHTLGNLAEYTGVKGGRFHRATADSLYLIHILQKGLETNSTVTSLKTLSDHAGGMMKL